MDCSPNTSATWPKTRQGPVVLMNYLKEIKAFYMRPTTTKGTVARWTLARIGEIIGGSGAGTPDVLDRRMVECGLDPAHYSWYRICAVTGGTACGVWVGV